MSAPAEFDPLGAAKTAAGEMLQAPFLIAAADEDGSVSVSMGGVNLDEIENIAAALLDFVKAERAETLSCPCCEAAHARVTAAIAALEVSVTDGDPKRTH